MQLTLHTDFALRVLIYLAQKKDGLTTITEIADFYHISRNHLVKVVHHLSTENFIQTTRGKHGGMRLARAPEMISVVMWCAAWNPISISWNASMQTANPAPLCPYAHLKRYFIRPATNSLPCWINTPSLKPLSKMRKQIRFFPLSNFSTAAPQNRFRSK